MFDNAQLLSLLLFVSFFAVFLGYLYSSFAIWSIANKTHHYKDRWMAFIPLLNLLLLSKMAHAPLWSFYIVMSGVFLNFLLELSAVTGFVINGFVTFFVTLILAGISAWWWWNIAIKTHHPKWYGILMVIPFINVVFMGIIAWVNKH